MYEIYTSVQYMTYRPEDRRKPLTKKDAGLVEDKQKANKRQSISFSGQDSWRYCRARNKVLPGCGASHNRERRIRKKILACVAGAE